MSVSAELGSDAPLARAASRTGGMKKGDGSRCYHRPNEFNCDVQHRL